MVDWYGKCIYSPEEPARRPSQKENHFPDAMLLSGRVHMQVNFTCFVDSMGKPQTSFWGWYPWASTFKATSCTSTWIFTISPEMLCMYDWESWLGVGLHTVVGLVGGLVAVGLVWSDFNWVWTLKLKQLWLKTKMVGIQTWNFMFVKGLLSRFAWSCGYRKVVEAQLSKMCVLFCCGCLFKNGLYLLVKVCWGYKHHHFNKGLKWWNQASFCDVDFRGTV